MRRVTFITGTDTGVGKTLLTGLLLSHLRHSGVHAWALKPFCSGGTADVDLLDALQAHELPRRKVNPFYFREPMSPLACARRSQRRIALSAVLDHVQWAAERCEHLLIEGSGGLMVPLGEDFTVLDLIRALGCPVIVASSNKLGTLNHTLLTTHALDGARVANFQVVLMERTALGRAGRDVSRASNAKIMRDLLGSVRLETLPFLGARACTIAGVKKNRKKIKKTLARILEFAIVSPTFFASKSAAKKS